MDYTIFCGFWSLVRLMYPIGPATIWPNQVLFQLQNEISALKTISLLQ